jgi:DegV family protein with EDD domain
MGGIIMKIAWVTDSTAHLDDTLQKRNDIFVVPLTIILDQVEYREGIDIQTSQLFDRLKTLQKPPTSSQPSIGTFKELYQSLADEYDFIFSIHLSSHLSGTYNTAFQASQMVDIPVVVLDSKIISYPLTYIIRKGIRLSNQGKSMEEITDQLITFISTNEAYVMVGSLEQLHRGGRMSGLQFFIGNLMNIKPIISIEDGALKIKEKVRSLKKGLEKVTSYIETSLHHYSMKEVFILYGHHDDEAKKWKNHLRQNFPHIEFSIYPLGSVIGIHAGENTIGISWFCDKDKGEGIR